MKKILILFLIAIFAISSNTAHADRSTSSWPSIPEAGTGVGIYGATYTEGIITVYPSFVMGSRKNPNGISAIDFVCQSATDPTCATDEFPGVAHMIIPPCEVDSSSMCI